HPLARRRSRPRARSPSSQGRRGAHRRGAGLLEVEHKEPPPMALHEDRLAPAFLRDDAEPRTAAPATESHRRQHDHALHHDHHDEHAHDQDRAHAFEWPEMARIAFVALAAAAVWFAVWEPLRAISLIG